MNRSVPGSTGVRGNANLQGVRGMEYGPEDSRPLAAHLDAHLSCIPAAEISIHSWGADGTAAKAAGFL
jgi:hypothetical protein